MKAAEALPGIICSGLGITKSVGSGCRYWRLNLYGYGNDKVIILQLVI